MKRWLTPQPYRAASRRSSEPARQLRGERSECIVVGGAPPVGQSGAAAAQNAPKPVSKRSTTSRAALVRGCCPICPRAAESPPQAAARVRATWSLAIPNTPRPSSYQAGQLSAPTGRPSFREVYAPLGPGDGDRDGESGASAALAHPDQIGDLFPSSILAASMSTVRTGSRSPARRSASVTSPPAIPMTPTLRLLNTRGHDQRFQLLIERRFCFFLSGDHLLDRQRQGILEFGPFRRHGDRFGVGGRISTIALYSGCSFWFVGFSSHRVGGPGAPRIRPVRARGPWLPCRSVSGSSPLQCPVGVGRRASTRRVDYRRWPLRPLGEIVKRHC